MSEAFDIIMMSILPYLPWICVILAIWIGLIIGPLLYKIYEQIKGSFDPLNEIDFNDSTLSPEPSAIVFDERMWEMVMWEMVEEGYMGIERLTGKAPVFTPIEFLSEKEMKL